jgi:hypothetical protein
MANNRLNNFCSNRIKVRVRTQVMKEYIGVITQTDYLRMTLMCDGLVPHIFDMRDVFDITPIDELP